MAGETSMPLTSRPASASGMARRPVPVPSSSTRPPAASRETVATVAPTSVRSAYHSSYTSAMASPYDGGS